MTDIDEWGMDPAVRAMRLIFRAMDDAQREFFTSIEIHMYDPRIRLWREKALALFENAFSYAHRTGIAISDETASAIYLHCLARVMRAQGINVDGANLPAGVGIENILKEMF